MAEKWVCEWESASTEIKKDRKIFNTYEDAYLFIRKELIAKRLDIAAIVNDLMSMGDCKYIRAITQFLENYVKDPCFPYSENDLPSSNPSDYDDYDLDVYDDIEVNFDVNSDELSLFYNGDNVQFLSTFIFNKGNSHTLEYHDNLNLFCCTPITRNGCFNAIELSLNKRIHWGSSAHSIMVLQVLQSAEHPLTGKAIAGEILDRYNEEIERKAVSRIIHVLQDLNYEILSSRKGYLLKKADT